MLVIGLGPAGDGEPEIGTEQFANTIGHLLGHQLRHTVDGLGFITIDAEEGHLGVDVVGDNTTAEELRRS